MRKEFLCVLYIYTKIKMDGSWICYRCIYFTAVCIFCALSHTQSCAAYISYTQTRYNSLLVGQLHKILFCRINSFYALANISTMCTFAFFYTHEAMAQLVARRMCHPKVGGSTPSSFIAYIFVRITTCAKKCAAYFFFPFAA